MIGKDLVEAVFESTGSSYSALGELLDIFINHYGVSWRCGGVDSHDGDVQLSVRVH